jgi:hypothetical protein
VIKQIERKKKRGKWTAIRAMPIQQRMAFLPFEPCCIIPTVSVLRGPKQQTRPRPISCKFSRSLAISTHHKVEILSPIKLVWSCTLLVWFSFFSLIRFFFYLIQFFFFFFLSFRLIKPNQTGQFFQNFNRFFFHGSVLSVIFFRFSQSFSFFTHS